MKIMHCHFDVLTIFCQGLFPWKFIGNIIYLEQAHSSNLKINYFCANVSQTHHSDEVFLNIYDKSECTLNIFIIELYNS